MKIAKKSLLAAVSIAAAMPSWADWETCKYQGDVVADGGTRVITKRSAGKTWDDWVWRGKQDGVVQYCSANSKGCTFNWGKSKTKEYSHTTGWSVGGGFGIPLVKGFTGTIEGQFQKSKTWTQSQTESFDYRTEMKPGKWAQPIIIAVRRWRQGHFNGGHILKYYANGSVAAGPKTGCYWYNWQWRDYGNWTGNEREWGYNYIQVADYRSQL